VNDPVDGVLAQREALDRGFSSSLLVSGVAHVALLSAAFLAAWLAPKEPLLKLAEGFAEVLPGGGKGNPNPAPEVPAPAPVKSAAPEPEVPAPPVTAPPIIKPPKEEPRKGLPELDSKPVKKKPAPTPARPTAAQTVATGRPAPSGGGGQGTAQSPFGLEFGKEGPGIPGGGDTGDYYLAGVQRKVWTIWMQQVKNDFTQPVSVAFTILADGSVTNVQVTRPSGIFLLDSAARRAVETAAPFNKLPRDYGTDQITVQANFKPTP
jgi:protein TonB